LLKADRSAFSCSIARSASFGRDFAGRNGSSLRRRWELPAVSRDGQTINWRMPTSITVFTRRLDLPDGVSNSNVAGVPLRDLKGEYRVAKRSNKSESVHRRGCRAAADLGRPTFRLRSKPLSLRDSCRTTRWKRKHRRPDIVSGFSTQNIMV